MGLSLPAGADQTAFAARLRDLTRLELPEAEAERHWKAIARNRKIARHHSRKPVKFPSVVLAYRKAGALKLTIQFSRKAQRNLRHGYNARLTLSMLAVDVARNQQKRLVKRIVKH